MKFKDTQSGKKQAESYDPYQAESHDPYQDQKGQSKGQG